MWVGYCMVLFICFIFATQRIFFFILCHIRLLFLPLMTMHWVISNRYMYKCSTVRFGVRVYEVNSCAKTSASFIHELKANQICSNRIVDNIFDWNRKCIPKLMKWISRDRKSVISLWCNDIVCQNTTYTHTHYGIKCFIGEISKRRILYTFHLWFWLWWLFDPFALFQTAPRRLWQEPEKCSLSKFLLFMSINIYSMLSRSIMTSMEFGHILIKKIN